MVLTGTTWDSYRFEDGDGAHRCSINRLVCPDKNDCRLCLIPFGPQASANVHRSSYPITDEKVAAIMDQAYGDRPKKKGGK